MLDVRWLRTKAMGKLSHLPMSEAMISVALVLGVFIACLVFICLLHV